jgi:hypothetical protein
MNRYGMPQNTDMAAKSSQPLRVMHPPQRSNGVYACRIVYLKRR